MTTQRFKIWQTSLIIGATIGVATLAWITFAQFFQDSSEQAFLPPPAHEDPFDKQRPGGDQFNPGEDTGYRLVISFEKDRLNPYPYGRSAGKVEVLDSQNRLVKIDGAVAIGPSSYTQLLTITPEDFGSVFAFAGGGRLAQYIPEAQSVTGGYIPGLKPIPLRLGAAPSTAVTSVGSLAALPMYQGVANFTYVHDGSLASFRTLKVAAVEFKTPEDGSHTLMPPPALLAGLNYPREAVGTVVMSQQVFDMGEFEDFPPPILEGSSLTTGEHYYTVTSSKEFIVRDPINEPDQTVEITVSPASFYANSESAETKLRAKLSVMSAYPNELQSNRSTYPGKFISGSTQGRTVTIEPISQPEPDLMYKNEELLRLTVSGLGEEAEFDIGAEPVTLTFKFNNEPSLLPYLGLFLEVDAPDKNPGVNTNVYEQTYHAKTTTFVPLMDFDPTGQGILNPWIFWLVTSQLVIWFLGLINIWYRLRQTPLV